MKKEIHRYVLEHTGEQTISLRSGSTPIAVKFWKGGISLWVIVDMDEERRFPFVITMIGTGHTFTSDPGLFIGSFVIDEHFIFHTFWKPYTADYVLGKRSEAGKYIVH